ncbi:hypothetical protein D3C76_1079260 [compost metagenome]
MIVAGIAIESVVALGRGDGRVVEVAQDGGAVPDRSVGELDAIDGMIGIEEMLADGEGLATGEDGQYQVVDHTVQPDLAGVEICESYAVEVSDQTAAVVDDVAAVPLTIEVGVTALTSR